MEQVLFLLLVSAFLYFCVALQETPFLNQDLWFVSSLFPADKTQCLCIAYSPQPWVSSLFKRVPCLFSLAKWTVLLPQAPHSVASCVNWSWTHLLDLTPGNVCVPFHVDSASGKEPACQYRRCKGQVPSLGREDPLEKCMANHSSTLAWRIPWTEEPGSLLSIELQSRTWLKWLSMHPYILCVSNWSFPSASYPLAFLFSGLSFSLTPGLPSLMWDRSKRKSVVFLMLIRGQNEEENWNLEKGKLFQMRREKKKEVKENWGQEDRKEERILRSETLGRN